MVRGVRGALPLAGLLAILGLGACGGEADDEAGERQHPTVAAGDLAQSIPADADFYFEGVLRPGAQLEADLESTVEAFGGDLDEVDEARAEILSNALRQLPLADPSEPADYESDVEPWLGERAAAFISVHGTNREIAAIDEDDSPLAADAYDAAVVLAVTDVDAAQDTVERLASPKAIADRPGTRIYVDGFDGLDAAALGLEDLPADQDLVLTEDRMIIGNEEGVEAALAAKPNPLSKRPWFRQGVAEVGSPQSLGFMLALAREADRLNLAREGARFATRHGKRIAKSFLYEPDSALTVELLASSSGVTVDAGYQLRGPTSLGRAARMARKLPADSFVAFADPILLPSVIRAFATGAEIGVERNPRRNSIARLGYDPVEAFSLLRPPAAVFAAEDGLAPLVGLLVAADPSRGLTRAPDAVRFALGSVGAGITPLDGDAYEFTARLPGLPVPIEVTQAGGELRVVAAQDPRTRREAVRPRDTLASTGELRAIAARLGDPHVPLGFFELEPAIEAFRTVPGALLVRDDGAPEALENARVDIGGRESKGNRIVLRLLLSDPAD